MQKQKYSNIPINVENEPFEKEPDDLEFDKSSIDDTKKIRIINSEELMEDTNLDIFGDNND